MALSTIKSTVLSSFGLKFFLGLFISFLLIGCGSESKIAVDGGSYHSLAIDSDGQVYSTGYNERAQLGLIGTSNRHKFTMVPSLKGKNITAVSAGSYYSLALDSKGNVYTTELIYESGSIVYDYSFPEIPSLKDKNIIAIAAGNSHSLVLDNNGKVYVMGDNYYGQLGLGDTIGRNTFNEITLLNGKNITSIAVGDDRSFTLDNNGKVYAAGDNYYGQLGLGDTNNRNTFTEILSLNGKNIIAIAAGADHSLALDSAGKVYGTGHNSYGQLGLGDTSSYNTFTEISSLNGKNIIAIAVGFYHSIAIGSDSKVYVSGNNGNGQLGLGDTNNRNTFTEISSLNGKNITAIAAGDFHSFVIGRDGKIYAAGHNYYGQLGLGDTSDRHSFTEITR